MLRVLVVLFVTLALACGAGEQVSAPPPPPAGVSSSATPPVEEESPPKPVVVEETPDPGASEPPPTKPTEPTATGAGTSVGTTGSQGSKAPVAGLRPPSGGGQAVKPVLIVKSPDDALEEEPPPVIAKRPTTVHSNPRPEPSVATTPKPPDAEEGEPAEEGLPVDEAPAVGEVPTVTAAPQGIDAWLAGLPTEALVFNVPEEILFDDETEVKLLIQPGAKGEELKATFEASRTDAQAGSVEAESARMSEEMGATLVSTKLQVTALTPERQFVSRVEPTEWRWVVRGSEEGSHGLILSLYAVLPQHSSVRVLKTFEREMRVKVLASDAAVGFAKENWEWLWTFLVAPIGAWMWARWKGQKDEAGEE